MRDGNLILRDAPTAVFARLNEGWPECGMETVEGARSAIAVHGV